MAARNRSRSPRRGGNVEEIVKLVVAREQARFSKDFATADSLRQSLQALGVTLFDKTNQWKASDGQTGRIPTFSEIESGQTAEAMLTQPQLPSPDAPEGSDAQIKYLVQLREQARAAKDFAQSDKLRDDLKAMGVDVYDKEKLWKSPSTGMQGIVIGYHSTGPPTDMEISTLVSQREKARQGNDYATADMIRDELKQQGVEIRDKDKIWRSSDGRSGPVPAWGGVEGHQLASMPPQTQFRGPAQSGNMQQALVQAAMNASQNPATAARTLQLLQQASGGMATYQPMPTASRRATSAVKAQPLTTTSSNAELRQALGIISQCQALGRAATNQEIEWLVSIREQMRQSKDFGSADELRNALRSSLKVELKEREKCWVAADGRQGAIPSWDNL